jgi:hypothetical protein
MAEKYDPIPRERQHSERNSHYPDYYANAYDVEIYPDYYSLSDDSEVEHIDVGRIPDPVPADPVGVFSIKLTTDRLITSGDPDGYAKLLYYRELTDSSDALAYKASLNIKWKNDFPFEVQEGGSFAIRVDNNRFIQALIAVYGNDDHPAVKTTLNQLNTSSEPFDEDQREDLILLAKYLHQFLPEDIELFNQEYRVRDYVAAKPLTEMTMKDLPANISALEYFGKDRISNVYEAMYQEEFEKYIKRDSPVLNSELEALKDKVNIADEDSMEGMAAANELGDYEATVPGGYFLDYKLEGMSIGLWDFIRMNFPGFDASDEGTPRAAKEEATLQATGVSYMDVMQFITLFQQKAMQKTYLMLDENLAVLEEQESKFSNLVEVGNLVEFVQSYAGNFNAVNDLRAETIQRFFEIELHGESQAQQDLIWAMETSSYEELVKELYKKSQEGRDALNEYLKVKGPVNIPMALAAIVARKHSLKPGEHHRSSPYDFVEQVNRDYSGLIQATAVDAALYSEIRRAAIDAGFPIIADLQTPLRLLTYASENNVNLIVLKKAISALISENKENNGEMRENLAEDPSKVWTLTPVLQLLKEELDITEGTNADIILNDIAAEVNFDQAMVGLALGALGIVLAVAGFVTGGSTWSALPGVLTAAGVAISGYDLYREIELYNFEEEARNTGIGEASQLSQVDPSLFGIILASIGLIIDVASIGKIVSSATKVGKGGSALDRMAELFGDPALAKEFDAPIAKVARVADEVRAGLKSQKELEESAEAVFDLLQKRLPVRKGVTKAEFVEDLLSNIKEGQKITNEMAAAFSEVGVKMEDIPHVVRFGYQKLFAHDPEAFSDIVKLMSIDPVRIQKLGVLMLKNDEFAASVAQLYRMDGLASKEMQKIIKYYSASGSQRWYDLPKALEVITESGLSDSKKIAEILTSSHFRNDILALADPAELKRLADAHAASGTKTSFFDYYMSNRYREGAVVEVKSGTSGNWVRSLNEHPLVPNTTYKVDGYIYRTDGQGRIVEVSGQLGNTSKPRNTAQQSGSVELKDGVKGQDDGGHLIGSRFGGAGEQINYVPMNKDINRSGGEWYALEEKWAAALGRNEDVTVEIAIIYSRESARPVGFRVDYLMDGKWNSATILND